MKCKYKYGLIDIYEHKNIGGHNTYHDCAGLLDASHALRKEGKWGSCGELSRKCTWCEATGRYHGWHTWGASSLRRTTHKHARARPMRHACAATQRMAPAQQCPSASSLTTLKHHPITSRSSSTMMMMMMMILCDTCVCYPTTKVCHALTLLSSDLLLFSNCRSVLLSFHSCNISYSHTFMSFTLYFVLVVLLS